LFQITQAGNAFGAFLRAGQCGQQHGRQYGDDGDDHQQFNQGEPMMAAGAAFSGELSFHLFFDVILP
jgi:hypothetical protein